jgi:peptide/nickel transport system substrate-binding protein
VGSALKLGRRALLAALALSVPAAALGRTHYGGRLRLKLPWPVRGGLDPHAIDDALAALVSSAVFDSLYARDASGRSYPTLASGLPERTAKGTRLALRPGLTTASGHALDARDVLWSLTRARQYSALGLLERFGDPRLEPSEPLTLIFPDAEPAELADALARPVTAILPRHFTRFRPDATGAFDAVPSGDKLLLRRNLRAARGPGFLDAIEVSQASDLADALRSFEADAADVGWLGAGYHRPRPAALRLEAGLFGWVVLRTGVHAGAWAAPGVAQRLLDAITPARLSHLGLRGLEPSNGVPAWGGPPAELLVPEDSPHLQEIGRALAALFTQPGHEVRALSKPRQELAARRSNGGYALLLDFVRSLGPTPADTVLALLTAADPNLARRPPRTRTGDARQLGQTLPLGVVGELHISGAYAPGVRGIADFNLANTARAS